MLVECEWQYDDECLSNVNDECLSRRAETRLKVPRQIRVAGGFCFFLFHM